jgi:A/G-specific adenine glycosylase
LVAKPIGLVRKHHDTSVRRDSLSLPGNGDAVGLPDSVWLTGFRRRLRAWYARHARDLPWRRSRDPYRIWVSEIMLQQTQVATVEPYFARFVDTWPTIADLAAAERYQVLRLWEGLGYYRRAVQMHEAAGRIVAEHGGQFPRDPQAVLRLPGIGRYTAGAILSIAFDARQPILEANTLRLFSRLLAFRGQPTSSAGQRLLWAMAEAVLPARHVGQFNQALMELGSQVCTPRRPSCGACPVRMLCRAACANLVAEIPRPKVKPAVEQVREAALIVRNAGRVLLVQRPAGARWAGLWDFPRFPVDGSTPAEQHRRLADALRVLTGIDARIGQLLTTLQHSVTRFRITLDCYQATPHASSAGGRVVGGNDVVMRWLRPPELADYPLSTTGRKLAQCLLGE